MSGVEAVCSGVATWVPSLQAPLPPASVLEATSSGTPLRLWAWAMWVHNRSDVVWL